jgi:hypothetical protein
MDKRHALIVDCAGTQAVGTPRHQGYAKSIHARRGIEKVGAVFSLHVIAYGWATWSGRRWRWDE